MKKTKEILNSQHIANFAVNRNSFKSEEQRNNLRITLKGMIDDIVESPKKVKLQKELLAQGIFQKTLEFLQELKELEVSYQSGHEDQKDIPQFSIDRHIQLKNCIESIAELKATLT